LLEYSPQPGKRNQVLVTNHGNQEGQGGTGKLWPQPSPPSSVDTLSRCASRWRYLFCALGQDDLAAFNELRSGPDIERTLGTFEVVFLELVALLAIELVEQVPFRQFLSNHFVVVHN